METFYNMALPNNGKGVLFTQASTIHGYGLFTEIDLPVETILCRRLGLRASLSLRDKRAIIGIDGFDPGIPDDVVFKSINHSCLPNAYLTDTGCLINTQRIIAGEEITINYCSLLTGSNWETTCFCGRSNCRRVIKRL